MNELELPQTGTCKAPLVKSTKPRVAACAACNRLKVKCVREGRNECKRCVAIGETCVTPQRHFGRTPGSKNKKTLLRAAQDANNSAKANVASPLALSTQPPMLTDSVAVAGPSVLSRRGDVHPVYPALSKLGDPFQIFNFTGEAVNLDTDYDYEPLLDQFAVCAKQIDPDHGLELIRQGLTALFNPLEASQYQRKGFESMDAPNLDCGIAVYDALTIGLVNWRDAELLFKLFFSEVQPSLRVLDPMLHTVPYVRSKSSLLFSVILELGQAYRTEDKDDLQSKLRQHNDWLASEIHIKGYKSVEICQALQLRSAWQMPNSTREQRVWQQLGAALTMAIELRLEAIVPLCASSSSDWKYADMAQQERIVRNCQRTWLCLYNRDRAIASMCGRAPVLQDGPLLDPKFMKAWHRSPYALPEDVTTVAAVSLRRLIPTTQEEVLASQESHPYDFEAVQSIVDRSIADWRAAWQPEMEDAAYAYYNLTASFTRFFLIATPYDTALRSRSLPSDTRDQLLIASLEACQAAVKYLHNRNQQYEASNRRQFAPTMRLTLIMYAAFASIKLLESCHDAEDGMGPSVDIFHLAILAQLAMQMKKIGAHSQGGSGVSVAGSFGEQLLAAACNVATHKVARDRAELAQATMNDLPHIPISEHFAIPSYDHFQSDDNFFADFQGQELWLLSAGMTPTNF